MKSRILQIITYFGSEVKTNSVIVYMIVWHRRLVGVRMVVFKFGRSALPELLFSVLKYNVQKV
jgi:hypothetical protein